MRFFLSLLLSLYFFSTTAQTSLNESLKQQMLKDWERAKIYTQEYLDAMPAAQYGFHAVDSIRSFAQQMLHLAFSNVALMFVGTGSHDSVIQKMYFTGNLEQSKTGQNKDSVVYYVNTSYDFAMKAIKDFDFARLTEMVTQRTPGGTRMENATSLVHESFRAPNASPRSMHHLHSVIKDSATGGKVVLTRRTCELFEKGIRT